MTVHKMPPAARAALLARPSETKDEWLVRTFELMMGLQLALEEIFPVREDAPPQLVSVADEIQDLEIEILRGGIGF